MAKMRLKMAKRSGQEGQDEAQDAKRRPQEGHEEPPRGTREAPRGPRGAPNRAKRRQKRAKRACSLRAVIFDTPPTPNGQLLLPGEENHTFGAIISAKPSRGSQRGKEDQGGITQESPRRPRKPPILSKTGHERQAKELGISWQARRNAQGQRSA